MRSTYVYRNGKYVNKATGKVDPPRFPGQICMPRINTSDSTEPLLSMADGKMYTSKAAMRQSYRASGNPQGIEYTEIGDDKSYRRIAEKKRKPDPKVITDAVDRAFADLSNGKFND